MSRPAHFGLSVVLGVVCWFCGVMGVIAFMASAASPSNSGIGYVIFIGLLVLASAYGALWNFVRVFRRSPEVVTSCNSVPTVPSQHVTSDMTPDEKLAPLVRKLKDDHTT